MKLVDTLGSVIHQAVSFRKKCDDGDGEFTVFFKGNREDMQNYAEYRVCDFFEGNETIYVRRIG